MEILIAALLLAMLVLVGWMLRKLLHLTWLGVIVILVVVIILLFLQAIGTLFWALSKTDIG